MFKALLKIRFAQLKVSFTGGSKAKKKPSPGKTLGYALLFLYLIGVFGFIFYQFFSAIAEVFYMVGVGWLYFAMFAMMGFALMFIFSVFTAKSQLFEATDNDLLLAMPIPPPMILSSRMLSLYGLNLVSEVVVAVPAAIAWCVSCPISAMGAVSFILLVLCLPLLSVALAALFGWLLSIITARLRKKSMVSFILSLAFLAAYFYGYSKVNAAVSLLVANSEYIAGKLQAAAPLYWMGSAVADGNAVNLLLSIACIVLPFVIAWVILSATFIRTATSKRGFAKIVYQEREQKVTSASSALFRREMGRFLSSSLYIMNAGLGAIFLVVAAALLIIKQDTVLQYLNMMTGFENFIIPAILLAECIMAGTIMISAPSISLEGKYLWIIKSLPVDPWQVLRSKLFVHLAVALPATFLAEIATLIVFRPKGLMLLLALVLPLLFNVFTALVGLVSNLKHPNFEWTNESQPIKGSVSLMISLLVTFTTVVLPAIAGYLLISSELSAIFVTGAYTLILAAASFVMYKWLRTRGGEIFTCL